MASAASDSADSATVETQSSRMAQLVRAGVLFASGLAIAFTATMHTDLVFDRTVLVSSLALIAAATFFEYTAMRGSLESWWIAARAIVALGAAGAMLAVDDSVSMALVVAVWAVLTALITALRMSRGAQPRRVALPSLLLSLALAIVALVAREDPIAVIGFFGAYAVMRGVFLAISAFDTRTATRTLPQPPAAEAVPEAADDEQKR